MKATKEALSPTRIKLTVEVPFDELRSDLDAAYKRIARQVRVPGFRPGKVPPRILDQRLGRGYVLNEALPGALDRFYGLALQQEQLDPISAPEDVDVQEFADGSPLVFSAELDVRPEITLPDLDGLEVQVDNVAVSEEEVDAQLDALRDRFSTLEPAERPIEDGDFLTLDIAATVNGEPVPGADSSGLSYEVGQDNLIEGLDEALRGANEGDERSFQSELEAGEFAGQSADVTVTVRSVKQRVRPELDDDFATTASEFDTLDELRADIRQRLERAKRFEQGAQARDKLLERLTELVEVPVPQSAVRTEREARLESIDAQLARIGMTREQYLEAEDKTEEGYEQELGEAAERAVKIQLILDALADAREVDVSQEELGEHLMRRAQQSGVSPQQFANELVQSGQVGVIYAEVRRGKALAQLMEQAKVVDASGNTVDLQALDEPDEDEAVFEDEAAIEDLDDEDKLGDEPEAPAVAGAGGASAPALPAEAELDAEPEAAGADEPAR